MKLPFFGESKKAEESAGRGYVPTDRVRELTGRGFSELDTIDVLRREGFSPDEIDKALTQTLKEGVIGNPADAMQQQQMPWQEQQPQMQPMQQPQTQPQYASFPQSRQPAQQPQKEQPEELTLPTMEDLQPKAAQASSGIPESSLPDEYYQGYPAEEYIDYVVQERTRDIVEKISEFGLRNRELEAKIRDMTERVGEMSKMRIGEQQQVLSTIEGLTDSVNDVNMRIAGLEKAFKDTLPALIESVRALSDLVGRVKREV
jgi:DNA-binding transcriptional MerR regulator